MKEQMGKFEEDIRQMKQVTHEGLKADEILTELKSLKELYINTQEELKIKDNNIVSLKLELDRAKVFQVKLTEKDDSLRKLKEELICAKENEAHTMDLLSSFKKRVHELEDEVKNRRLSESKIFDSLVSQIREYEQTKIELDESKHQISSLHEEIESLVASSEQNNRRCCDGSCNGKIALEKELGCLRFEVGLAKANLDKIQEREKFASSKAKALSDEMNLVKNELKFAIDAEQRSQKALDDLALALKQVVVEASEAKQKLSASQLELEQVKDEAGQLKHMVRNTEARYQKLLDEAKKETTDRLRMQFDESILAEREKGYITCIKKAEEEKARAQHESARLAESLKAAERMARVARKEIHKLKGILKQAINDANAAKAAADLARDGNIQLKDSIAEKEEMIRVLTQEKERLRINEVAAPENVKELKRLLSSSSLKIEDKEQEEEPQVKKTSSVNHSELNLQQEHENTEAKIQDENPEKSKELQDSIFDINEPPKSELHTPKQVSHNRKTSSSAYSEDEGTLKKSSSSLENENKEQKEEHYEDPKVKKTSSLNHSEFKLRQEQENTEAKIQDENTEKPKEDLCISLRKSLSSLINEDKEQEEEHYEDSQVKKTSILNHSELKLQQEQEDLKAKIQDEDTKNAEALKGSSSLENKDKEQEEEHYEDSQVKKTSILNHNELKLQQEQEDLKAKIQDEDHKNIEALKGSTFDNESSKPEADHHTTKQVSHHGGTSSPSFSDDGGTLKTEDSNSDRNRSKRKKPLFRRVGDLIMRKSFHKRHPSTE